MAVLNFNYSFNQATTEPPTGQQLRFDADPPSAVTRVWITNTTSDNQDAFVPLMALGVGAELYVQDKTDHDLFARFTVIAPPVDKDTYVEVPVAWVANGAAMKNQQMATLYLLTAEAGPTLIVPSLIGLLQADAENAIATAGLALGVLTTAPSSTRAAGVVSAQAPSAGVIVAPTALVALTVSSGLPVLPPPGGGGGSGTPTIRSVLAVPIDPEPLTLDEAKLRAGLDWAVGDPRDALMLEFIAAARQQVESDTGLAVPTQSRDLFLDALPAAIPWRALPVQSWPLQQVSSLTAIDSAGAATVLDPADYLVVVSNDGLMITIAAPPADVQRWVVRIVAGFNPIPPSLLQAVALLTAHYATIGRDLTMVGDNIVRTPLGYADAIAAFTVVSLM